MITLAEVQAFCTVARAASTHYALLQAVEEITAAMGFRYFALVHHIDLLNPGSTAVRLVNYPRNWVDAFEEGRLYAADPIHRASHTTTIGFAWSKVEAMISLHPRDHAVLAAARSAGLGDGFTIPAHVPGEVNGSCSFAMRNGEELDEEQLPLVQLVGSFAFEAARKIARATIAPIAAAPQLTERQIECVALVARGKTDWEIAKILGVGAETVTQHLKDARDRYGVTKRTMLAIRALFDGTISFTDILR